jgi:hypothetical protein
LKGNKTSQMSPKQFATAIRASGLSPDRRVKAVSRVVHMLKGATARDRVSYTSMAYLSRDYTNLSALVCYKGFSKTEAIEYAASGGGFPSSYRKTI